MVSIQPFLLQHLHAIAIAEGLGADFLIELEAGSKHGDGFLASMLAVKLTSKNCAQRVSLICKLLPDNQARMEMFQSQMVFAQEVKFYNALLPLFKRLQLDHGLTEKNGFFGYPRCYYASDVPGESVIIMQDLRADGFALWDKLVPIDVTRVGLLIEQLGRFHGLSFVMRDKHPESFECIRSVKDIMLPVCGVEPMLSMFMNAYDQAIEILDRAEHKDVMRWVKGSWKTLMEDCLNAQLAEPFAVLGHGDCWNNNMMYQENKRICLLDWQCCRFVSPVLDLTYFLMTCPDKILREQHYEQLLRVYYENLAQTIRLCGSDPERLFPWTNFLEQLRQFGKFGIVMAPLLLQVMVSDPKDIFLVDDMANAVGTDKEKSSFAVLTAESTEKYRQRLGDSIDDAKRWGWI